MVAFAAVSLLVLLPLVSVSSLAPTVSTLDSVCRIISGYHCDDYFQLDQQCGTDGITYNNMCEFSKAHCQLRNLHIAHTGVCETGHVVQSTRVPGAHGTYEFFCQTLVCGDDREVVCASNGHTYLNLCLFESQRCHNSSLTIVDYQACPSL
ncbi:agrin-like [Pomacea canaliculata]|uniref:agrin-like n=1 Tax=Pomacea canaliculata TaxID=400727 RepID=UPI000D72A1D5|nr:agrin-like [Pomacea canaliculata]